jgi:UDP-glucose-4-epimerase GalE
LSHRAILVTGGAGYIGAHACKALCKAGHLPVTLDNLSTGHKHFVRWGPLVQADIRDTAAVCQTIQAYEIKAVLHFAASAYVGESVANPQKYYENNVAGSLSLLAAMLQGGCRNLVFSSSCAVYGEPDEVPIRETSPHNPINPYGASKAMIERVLTDYERAQGICAIALRYFNASGADPEGEIGELRDPETHLIPRAMMAIQGHLSDFAVFGDDYPTPDGTPIRDYVHVSDVADAHLAALRHLLEGGPGGAYNLGSGRGYSVKQVLEAIAAETGEDLEVTKGCRREGDPAVLVADSSLSHSKLAFAPRMSDLDTIIKTAWAWHRRAHPKTQRAEIEYTATELSNFKQA